MVEASAPNAKEFTYWNGANGREWVRFQESMDGMLRPLRWDASEDVQARIANEMREAMMPHLGADGVRIGCSNWLATAVAP